MLSQIEREIKLAAQLYYQDGSSFLTDAQFDAKVAELKKENPFSEILINPSYGYDVGEDSTVGQRLYHRYCEVGTLDKVYEWNDLPERFRWKDIYATPKFDGMSVALYYIDGELDHALTRGNYVTGIDITDKVRMIIGTKIDDSLFTGAVRGEIIMTKDNYKKFCDTHDDVKNPRNATAGLINSKGISEDLKYLDIVVYTILADENSEETFESINDVINRLQRNFENVTPVYYIPNYMNTSDNLLEVCNHIKDNWEDEIQFEIDGIVVSPQFIEIDDNGVYKWDEVAIKFASETAISKVTGVEWTMSKTHYAIPVVQIEPVELCGTTVQRATGFNAQYILDNAIGEGVEVEVEKHGEIIPNINSVISHPSDVDGESCIIHNCPICGEELEWEGVHLKCNNPACQNTKIQDTLVWLNTLAPVDNFGDKLRIKFLSKYMKEDEISVESIMENDTLKTIANQFLVIRDNKLVSKQQILFSEMLNKLFYGTYDMTTAVKALNIPRFGDVNSEKLGSQVDICESIYEVVKSDSNINTTYYTELEKKMGVANAESIKNNLSKFRRWDYLDCRLYSSYKSSDVEEKGTVAITGKLSVKRTEFEKELKSAGWKVGEISKNTNYLITDNPGSSSSKNKKADAWGITKITESEFREKFM